MLSPGRRLKLRYCCKIAAVLGKVCRTSGEAASLRRRTKVPPLLSNSDLFHDMAKRRAVPCSWLISLEATYRLLFTGVEDTYQATSFVYLRHPFA